MRFEIMQRLEILIDGLTRSVIDKNTGISHSTIIKEMDQLYMISLLSKYHWEFDWKTEFLIDRRNVFSLSLKADESIILGMISLEVFSDHVFVYLVERRGKKENPYLGIGGNLFAFACKHSYEKGLNGNVAFLPKPKLKDHFSVTLGAVQLLQGRMGIFESAAQKLIQIYFPDETSSFS